MMSDFIAQRAQEFNTDII